MKFFATKNKVAFWLKLLIKWENSFKKQIHIAFYWPRSPRSKEEHSNHDERGNFEAETVIAKTNQSEWACGLCDKKLTTRTGLLYHIQSKHKGKKHPCQQCDHQATNSSNLNLHVKKVHEGIRYHCIDCDFKATRSNILKRHVESIH